MAFDNLLMFKSSGNLTKSGSGTAITLHGTAVKGASVRINIPSSVGTSNQILFDVMASDNGTLYRIIATYPGGYQSYAASGTDELIIPFATDKKYVNVQWTVVGSTGGANFGAVSIGLESPSVGFDWIRAENFE